MIYLPDPFDQVRSDLLYEKACQRVTPLHVASVKGHIEVLGLLLK